MAYNCIMGIGTAHFIAGRYEQAIEWQERRLMPIRQRRGYFVVWFQPMFSPGTWTGRR